MCFIVEKCARGLVDAVAKTGRVGIVQRVVLALALKEETSSLELFRLLYFATKLMDQSIEAVHYTSPNDETTLSTVLVGSLLGVEPVQ